MPTLAEALDYMTANQMAMVLALDMRDAAVARRAFDIISQHNDYQGHSYLETTLFKVPAKAFPTVADFHDAFPSGNWKFVQYQPVYNTGDIAPGVIPTELQEFSGTDVASGATGFGSEQRIIEHLRSFEQSDINVVAVEIQIKAIGGILTDVLAAAKRDAKTGESKSVTVFSPYVDYYAPEDRDRTDPLFYKTDGSCCQRLSDFYYNGTPNGQPSDTRDDRGSMLYVNRQGFSGVTTDNPVAFTEELADIGRRNISYLQGSATTTSPGDERLRIMPVGDSITAGVNSGSGDGYPGPLKRRESGEGHPVDFVGSQRTSTGLANEGWSGQEIDFIRDKAMANIKDYFPNVVTLMAGTNDIGHGREAGAADRLVAFVRQIHEAVPDAQVVVGGLLPDADAATAAGHQRFTGQVQNLLSSSNLFYVRFVSFNDLDPHNEMAGLHPNDSGYAKMANTWGSAIDALLRSSRVAKRDEYKGGSGGSLTNCTNQNTWFPQGNLTLGNGHDGDQIHLADLNGDGRDDYLAVNKDGSVDAYVNGGGQPNHWIWYDYGRVAGGVGASGRNVMFADINGDGRDDYLAVGEQGRVDLHINGGGVPGKWIWYDEGKIADGIGKTVIPPESTNGELIPVSPYDLTWGDLNGDGRDDYIVANRTTGAAEAYLVLGDPFHPTLLPKGTIAYGAGPNGLSPQFENIDCDARGEYLRIDSESGAITGYRNDGPLAQGGWSWAGPLDIAYGTEAGSFNPVQLADMNGDGRADYVPIGLRGELLDVYLRG